MQLICLIYAKFELLFAPYLVTRIVKKKNTFGHQF